jgi:hypothetical protein
MFYQDRNLVHVAVKDEEIIHMKRKTVQLVNSKDKQAFEQALNKLGNSVYQYCQKERSNHLSWTKLIRLQLFPRNGEIHSHAPLADSLMLVRPRLHEQPVFLTL